MAKIKIVALKIKDEIFNILTTIKQSSYDKQHSNFVKIANFQCLNGETINIYEGFLRNKQLSTFQQELLNQQKVIINDEQIKYNVCTLPRQSFLSHRDDWQPDTYNQILSPFYSNCDLDEYWNVDIDFKNIFMKLEIPDKNKFSEYLDVNLYNLIDRIGNVLHFIDINEIDVDIAHQNSKYITLGFQKYNDTDDYLCNIKVKSYDDLILNKTFEIKKRFEDIKLQDSDYEINIEIINLKTGKCVCKRKMVFWGGGNPKIHYIKNNIEKNKNYYSIETVKQKKTFIESVSSLEHTRKLWTNDLKRKKDLDFLRYSNKQDGYSHLTKLLQDIAKYKGLDNYTPEYIYLMDPYLFSSLSEGDYIGILNSVNNIEFRLMGCYKTIPDELKKIIINNPYRYKNIKIKLFCLKSNDKKGKYEYLADNDNKINKTKGTFHDRWIATKNIEYGFTNSINNFQKGVSFFKSYEHYFNEAETLWNTFNESDTIIKEFSYNDEIKRFEEK